MSDQNAQPNRMTEAFTGSGGEVRKGTDIVNSTPIQAAPADVPLTPLTFMPQAAAPATPGPAAAGLSADAAS